MLLVVCQAIQIPSAGPHGTASILKTLAGCFALWICCTTCCTSQSLDPCEMTIDQDNGLASPFSFTCYY